MRPGALCYCAHIHQIQNRTRIVVLQHIKERFHPLNTVRIAERCLKSVAVHCGLPTHLETEVLNLAGPKTVVLFPEAGAQELESIAPENRPDTVIVLDGTWHQAKTLLRDVPSLAHIPRVRFHPPRPSEYRIRKEPQADYLSSIESISHVLHLLEPETKGLSHLRDAFVTMIDKNIGARRKEDFARKKAKIQERSHKFPPLLTHEHAPLWVLYTEGAPYFSDAPRLPTGARSPFVVYGALLSPEFLSSAPRADNRAHTRLDGFARVLKTEAPPAQKLLDRLGFSRQEQLQSGLTTEQAAVELCSIVPRDAILSAFNTSTFALLSELLSELFSERGTMSSRHLHLKGAYCDFARFRGEQRRAWGSLAEILARERLTEQPSLTFDEGTPSCLTRKRGRGVERVIETAMLLKHLKNEAECAGKPHPG